MVEKRGFAGDIASNDVLCLQCMHASLDIRMLLAEESRLFESRFFLVFWTALRIELCREP
jgi:hypothetical protein